jgi:hypothetical protein
MKDKLAIIVPFRDRQDHLDIFVPHMHSFLKDKGIEYTIFIAEQADDRPFNYGKLCNVVVSEIGEEYTYFAFHDIDMLPINDDCDYGYPDAPIHLATQVQVHNYKLPYVQYFGGVVLINREDFVTANGYSNEYWGYGFEDLDLLFRLKESGAYLEKFYDLNKTYSNYNELDILPYRIEDVSVSLNERTQMLAYSEFRKTDYLYGVMNKITSKLLNKNFCVSFWFNDDSSREIRKNLFSFEGSDTGVFLSNGNQLIFQTWDTEHNNYDVIVPYFRNRWNHCVFSYDSVINEIVLYINNIRISKKLNESFQIFDYTNHCIKISDETTEIKLSNILLYAKEASDKFVEEMYYNGESHLDLIESKYGYYPQIYFKYDKLYRNNLLLDSGICNNHIKIYGNISSQVDEVELTNKIYLPIRLEGKYNSLTHENDTDIISLYYKYNPDIIENADIFFDDIITNEINFKEIGLNSLDYDLVKEKKEPNYELYRIIT